MPIYEFRCSNCGNEFTQLIRNPISNTRLICPGCGGAEIQKKISAFAVHVSESTRIERAGSPDKPGADYYNDPRNIGRWTENKFKEMGVDMPSHIKNMIDSSRDGQIPDSMKDLKRGPTEI